MSRPRFVCLAFVMAAFAAPIAVAEEPGEDVLVLASGERFVCEILKLTEHSVRVRVGDQTYDFERASLTAIERAGETLLDPDHLAFVRDLAPRLVHRDARLAAAALAGLRALGDDGKPYLEAVANETKQPKIKAALRAVHEPAERAKPAPQPSAMIDAWIERAKTTLALEAKQEAGFRKAVESFFQDGRSSGDWQAAWQRMRASLETVLSAEQLKKFDAMRANRGGG